jgi:hypothetical protein
LIYINQLCDLAHTLFLAFERSVSVQERLKVDVFRERIRKPIQQNLAMGAVVGHVGIKLW